MLTKKIDYEMATLCLDFANTLEWHASDRPVERQEKYADLLAWAVEKHLVDSDQLRVLEELAHQSPKKASATFGKAIDLRETIYRIFADIAHDRLVADEDLQCLNDELVKTCASARIAQMNGRFNWTWSEDNLDLERVLRPILKSAAQLLTTPELMKRVGQCADDRGCGYLFIDLSKNHSRKWCDINDCGNRAKQRRYYRKNRSS
jgi:predicted RNA-binding Zn ribbon-like protein